MQAYQTAGPGEPLVRVESETPVPQGSEVLVRTVCCGVCHSDIHLHDAMFDLGGGQSLNVGRPGMVLGHEVFGEVVAMGPQAQGVEVGDRRVVYPWIGCGECATCQRDEEHLCTPGQAIGIARGGGFGDHVLVPDGRYLFDKGDVPDSLAATYACSGLTAYAALKKVGSTGEQDHVVIIGAGGVGSMGIQIARSVLDMDPIVVDIDDRKLEAVMQMGVRHAINPNREGAQQELMEITGGGAYAAVDFVGAESSVNFGMSVLRKGGSIIVVGLFGGGLSMPLPFIPMMQRRIQGSFVGSLEDMDELMAFVREGKVAPIGIEERPMAQVTQTLADLKAGKVAGRAVLMAS